MNLCFSSIIRIIDDVIREYLCHLEYRLLRVDIHNLITKIIYLLSIVRWSMKINRML